MTFQIVLSVVAMVTAVVGCALIWGYDVARAHEIVSDPSRLDPAGPSSPARPSLPPVP